MKKLLSKFFSFGCYRVYFHIGRIGFKIARPTGTNKLASLLCGCVMNLLERKRYLYYSKLKPMKQWRSIWKSEQKLALNPTYFSCGLFSIVRHCDRFYSNKKCKVFYKGKWINSDSKELPEDFWYYSKLSHYLFYSIVEFSSSAQNNIGVYKGKLYALDYGDFNINKANHLRVQNIDYR